MRITFLGDSLTEGWPGAAFFPRLDRSLPQHELRNRGRAGDTVADLLRRVRHEGLEPTDVVFIWIGTNDAVISAWDASEAGGGWSWPERLARLRNDYGELLEWTAARAAQLVLVHPIILESEGSLGTAQAAEIRGAITELAAPCTTCREFDLSPAFAAAARAGAGPFTTDGVHFTDAGAEVVAGAFAAAIAEIEAEKVTL